MSEQMKFEAPTLEEAYKKASEAFGKSITELDVKILQHPSKGILGIGKKNAIVLVCEKSKEPEIPAAVEKPLPQIETDTEEKEIFDNFYKEEKNINEIAKEVQKDINRLFQNACFEIDTIEVKPYDKETLLVEFNGNDAALLIGKEGYRYKALSYMLFNWINPKYGLQLRLEIAEFLKTQEEMIANYLAPIIERIKEEGKGQTKPLDGVLVQIALKQLREAFPDKYVAMRENRYGQKYVIVNEYRK
ncbi:MULTISPECIES: Jag N-terminal domain-containing protein [unclassified Nitratiruptor]|uniref:Jag N-terminal domain-containing protein n=1 Tax=unclassified Nitratiruptor TaxID=2624044 RepID=UPI0019166D27|nr:MULTISPECIES: Jag N-terminal domain-containing protein [unclassified Nitratiruptor]BCD60402.1 spoIIIJ-associated protein [Nitratiruptor sp. YY08-10]BCD64109.1 spoIIIJ-associated protein [Nitratiruptor sp. YY08-14]